LSSVCAVIRPLVGGLMLITRKAGDVYKGGWCYD
jgi:hypothetical protein